VDLATLTRSKPEVPDRPTVSCPRRGAGRTGGPTSRSSPRLPIPFLPLLSCARPHEQVSTRARVPGSADRCLLVIA